MKNRTTKTNGLKDPKFRKLTRADLTAFDNEATNLIMTAIDAGCLGRVSAKTHCILRNNNGGTVAVPRHMTSPNRTAQNARASMRRLLADQRTTSSAALLGRSATRDPQTMTVSQAFVEHGAAFTRWFDEQTRQGDGLAADLLLYVSFDNEQPNFEVIAAPTSSNAQPTPDTPTSASSTDEDSTEPQQSSDEDTTECEHVRAPVETPSEPESDTTETPVEPHPYTCQICGRICGSPAGLGAHNRVHKPTAKPTTAQSPKSDENAAAVLAHVRQALGEDPRIAVLESRITELERQLADSKAQTDETQTRLNLIQEALGA